MSAVVVSKAYWRPQSVLALSETLGHALMRRRCVITTAESCTGGGLAAAITDIAGSSAWFHRGFVTYSNEAKSEMLGVPSAELMANGAVSYPVVAYMARGALERSGAQIAVAVSGVAGPGGGSEEKPVGTVFFAWCWRSSKALDGVKSAQPMYRLRRQVFSGDRQTVRQKTQFHALQGAYRSLDYLPV